MPLTPNDNDVLLGRGRTINSHPGNLRLRTLVSTQKVNYQQTKHKEEKRQIALNIVQAIQSLSPPGRFLIDTTGGKDGNITKGRAWICVEREKAIEKVLHRLREKDNGNGNDGNGRHPLEKQQLQRQHDQIIQQVAVSTTSTSHVAANVPSANVGNIQHQSLQSSIHQSKDLIDKALHRLSNPDINQLWQYQLEQIQQTQPSHGVNTVSFSAYNNVGDYKADKLKTPQSSTNENGSNNSHRPNQQVTHKVQAPFHADQIFQSTNLHNNMIHNQHPTQQVDRQPNVHLPGTSPPCPLVGSIDISQTRNFHGISTAHTLPNQLHSRDQIGFADASAGNQSGTIVQEPEDPQRYFNIGNSQTNQAGQQPTNTALLPIGGITFAKAGTSPMFSIDRPTPFDQLLDLIQPQIQENSEQGEKIIHLAHGIMPEDKLDLSKSPAAQVKECDDKVNAFISQHFDRCEKSQVYQQASLRQWIEMSKPRINADKVSVKENISTGYVNSALSIAGMLADFLNTSNAPLESITAANVMIRFVTEDNLMKKSDDLDLSPPGGTITWAILSDEVAEEKSANNIVNVGVLRCARENPNVGSKMSHLYTLGAILYEILSQGDSSLVNALNLIGASKSRSFGAIDLMGEGERSDSSETIVHRKKKTPSHVMSNHYSKLLVCLERIGIPQSLCALVKNLLDCNEGEFCGDDAYKSFSDVILDLQLMRDHPSRFLDNIEVGHDHSFSISDKLYGREDEITRIEHACERSAKGECSAVMIVGEAGVGKSKLAMHVQDLTNKAHGYFVRCKFDQNKDIKPLSVIGSAFNYMCDMFARDIKTRHDEQRVADALESALGDPSSYCNLVEVLPSLSKLMPLYSNYGSSHSVDPATSTRFLFLTLLHTLSFHFSKPITIFLDDIQWIDQTSLMLLSSLIDHTKRNKFVFFVFCCRDGEIQDTHSEPVYISLRSLSKSVFEQINLTNLNADGVNTLVSDTLQLSPRLTRPLSLVLFSKTLGNPFFLRQTMNMLKKEGYIYFSLKGHRRRWMWDLEKISDLPIDENVLVLLIREMKKLPNDLQLGLKVASCMGASVNIHIVDILSRHCGVNLSTILLEASQKGYMYKDEIGTTQFRFVHDRVQQAAYENMSEQQRRESHMTFGLAICSHAMGDSGDNGMLFIAANQINRGGQEMITCVQQKTTIAALNLKVGKKSMELTDSASALAYFENGISFLNAGHWDHQYELSIGLFDAAADAACELNDAASVHFFTECVLENAKNLYDKLNAMYVNVRFLRMARALPEVRKFALLVLEQLGEDLPTVMGDTQLETRSQSMMTYISGLPDDSIINLSQSNVKNHVILMKLYYELLNIHQLIEPKRILNVSLRMVQLSLDVGCTEVSPLAFAYFGASAVMAGNPSQAYRLGSLALRLATKLNATGYMSMLLAVVQSCIAWVSEPFQSLAESHLLGYQAGERSDLFSSSANYISYLNASFSCGKHLDSIRDDSSKFIEALLRKNIKWFLFMSIWQFFDAVALIEGLEFKAVDLIAGIPSENDIVTLAARTEQVSLSFEISIHQMMRSFFFRQHNEMLNGCVDVSQFISKVARRVRPLYLNGVFFEGLISFCMARQTKQHKWVYKGEAALTFMKKWTEFSSWNFENKSLLLEAENMFLLERFDQADRLYTQAIRSAQKHKILHEEAISCELAGLFYHDRNDHKKAFEYLTQAVCCYRQWGAEAVAKRVEKFIQYFEPTSSPPILLEGSKSYASLSDDNASKRRQDFD